PFCRARHFDLGRRCALGRVAGDRDLPGKTSSVAARSKFNRDGGLSMRLNQRRALARYYIEELAPDWRRDGHRQRGASVVYNDEGLGLSRRPARQIDFPEVQRG